MKKSNKRMTMKEIFSDESQIYVMKSDDVETLVWCGSVEMSENDCLKKTCTSGKGTTRGRRQSLHLQNGFRLH